MSGFSNFRLVDNGQKAVEAAKLENFDVILMDCMMPIMSGIEATEHIRKELKAEQQPIIIGKLTLEMPLTEIPISIDSRRFQGKCDQL